jgi:hypothetical protein
MPTINRRTVDNLDDAIQNLQRIRTELDTYLMTFAHDPTPSIRSGRFTIKHASTRPRSNSRSRGGKRHNKKRRTQRNNYEDYDFF